MLRDPPPAADAYLSFSFFCLHPPHQLQCFFQRGFVVFTGFLVAFFSALLLNCLTLFCFSLVGPASFRFARRVASYFCAIASDMGLPFVFAVFSACPVSLTPSPSFPRNFLRGEGFTLLLSFMPTGQSRSCTPRRGPLRFFPISSFPSGRLDPEEAPPGSCSGFSPLCPGSPNWQPSLMTSSYPLFALFPTLDDFSPFRSTPVKPRRSLAVTPPPSASFVPPGSFWT